MMAKVTHVLGIIPAGAVNPRELPILGSVGRMKDLLSRPSGGQGNEQKGTSLARSTSVYYFTSDEKNPQTGGIYASANRNRHAFYDDKHVMRVRPGSW
jgi:hypothetical protein